MYGVHPNPRDRLISAGGAAILCGVVGYALILGLGVRMPVVIPDAQACACPSSSPTR